MLDHQKVLTSLEGMKPKLFCSYDDEYERAKLGFKAACDDPLFIYKAEAEKSCLLARWQEPLGTTFPVANTTSNYTVLSVDGSQIYPDRHVGGAGCFLINTGSVFLEYDKSSTIILSTEPYLLLTDEVSTTTNLRFSPDMVDLLREAYELNRLYQDAIKHEQPPLCLVDGSLIFWQLEGKEPDVKSYFLTQYLAALDLMYQKKILVAGYISFPKSRELVNIIKLELCKNKQLPCAPCPPTSNNPGCQTITHLVDSSICSLYVQPWFRTQLFSSRSKIIDEYPNHLKPYFFYMDVEYETIRIEIPQWIAQDIQAVDHIASQIKDQVRKGLGYPVVLAEAHNQAVVTGIDRDFFYHLLRKVGLDAGKTVSLSQKSFKKRHMGI